MASLFKKMDKLLLFLMIAFTIFGLYMVFSASSITAVLFHDLPEHHYAVRQLVFIIGAWIAGMVVLTVPIKFYKPFAPYAMVGIVAALIFVFSYGTFTNNVRRWFDVGFFAIQPSEFAKSIIIVYLAFAMEKLIRLKKTGIDTLFWHFLPVAAAVVLVIWQPDLGTAMILGLIVLLIFLSLPIKTREIKFLKILAIIFVVAAGVLVAVAPAALSETQASRFNYRAPCTRYTENSGYQVCNGLIAIANGGLFGVGLGNSTQKYLYLPEAHTDFIFPIIIEELGAIAGIIIILLFIILLWRVLMISRNAGNLSGSIIAYGTFCFILLHLLVNFMGVLALIPLTGISVPFLSYGGSFYINIILMLFLVQRVRIEAEDARKARVLGE